MRNTDKISAYLDNEMSAADKKQFEQELANDRELNREFNLHKDVIEGIKEARKQELKAMLDQVPVAGGPTGTITFGKIASGVAIIGALAIGIYYISDADEDRVVPNKMEEPLAVTPEIPAVNEATEKDRSTQETKEVEDKNLTKTETSEKPVPVEEKEPQQTTTEVKQPEIKRPSAAPLFETSDTDSLEAPTNAIVKNASGNISSLDVEIDGSNNKYDFHYQFNRGKLHLYGDFDKELYQILEFKAKTEKALFLYYDNKFYPLNKDQVRIVELTPVTDQLLIEKLNTAVTQD